MVSEVVPYAGTPACARGLVIPCKHACMLWWCGLVPAEVVELASVSQLLSSALGEVMFTVSQVRTWDNLYADGHIQAVVSILLFSLQVAVLVVQDVAGGSHWPVEVWFVEFVESPPVAAMVLVRAQPSGEARGCQHIRH